MDPRKNPYAPGAGYRPPELAGRGEIVEQASIALDRIKNKKPSRSLILYGLRGVGKTVLLNEIRRDAESMNIYTAHIEAPEERSLPAVLIPAMRSILLKISRSEKVKIIANRALSCLGGFASALKIKYNDIEVGLDLGRESGVADSGDLEMDLIDLLTVVGEVAQAQGTAVVLFVDELQYVPEEQIAALITALHRVSQNQLPITMVAAGLPQLLGHMGRAKSYAERLFSFVSIDRLDETAARDALCKPAEKEGARFDEDAIKEIIKQTLGYPYFLQEWGKHSWDIAKGPNITLAEAKNATASALNDLDASFFRVRFDRLTPLEKKYVRAMAELGAGPHRSGDIADKLKRKVSSIAPIRSSLIAKGMIYSPTYGDTAFTVPLFEGFMKRIVPTFSH